MKTFTIATIYMIPLLVFSPLIMQLMGQVSSPNTSFEQRLEQRVENIQSSKQ